MTVLDAHIAHHKHVQSLYVGHFIYELVYAMGWDGHHLTLSLIQI